MAKKPTGLGRGLSSLFGDMEVDLSVLDPAEISIDPQQEPQIRPEVKKSARKAAEKEKKTLPGQLGQPAAE